MKQTAVEWLVEELEMIENSYHSDSTDYVDSRKNAIELAKYMENQQQGYSDEDIVRALHSVELKDNKDYSKIYHGMKEWFEQFKNK